MNYLFAGMFVFFSSLFSCQPKGDYITLSVDEFEGLIKDRNIQRLDVRTLGEYSEGHIPGALNINVLNESFAAMADSTLQKTEPVALYCRSGKRSKKAAAILSSKGYRVYELGEGFNAWLESEKEIEK
ncbi:MAG: rhodanese-like domain-containing protein [Bacteroides sp.]